MGFSSGGRHRLTRSDEFGRRAAPRWSLLPVKIGGGDVVFNQESVFLSSRELGPETMATDPLFLPGGRFQLLAPVARSPKLFFPPAADAHLSAAQVQMDH